MSALALDIETAGKQICRIGLATRERAGTFDWGRASKDLTQRLVSEAGVIIAHNATFDVPRLESEGVEIDRSRVWDTMRVHALIYPYCLKGLGHAAPMYVPIRPWKHKDRTDPEAYNLMDTAVLLPMYEAQHDLLAEWGAVDLWWNLELPAMWELYRMEIEGYRMRTRAGTVCRGSSRYRLAQTGHGPYATLTGRMEAHDKPLPAPWGTRKDRLLHGCSDGRPLYYCQFLQPELDLVGAFIGSPLEPNPAIKAGVRAGATGAQAWRAVKLWTIGCGPRQLGERTGISYHVAKTIREAFDLANPGFVKWREGLMARATKERFIQNPFGRRVYGLKNHEAQSFLILSTISDILLSMLPQIQPVALLHDGFITTDPQDSISMACCIWPQVAPGLALSTQATPIT